MTPRVGPPDFVGIGAQRSGTTWWFELLLDHPRIRPPKGRRKELHFFDRFGAEPMTDADVRAYHERFPRRPGQLAGEWTPRYTGDAWTLRLLRRAAPDARLLLMLRDPVERYRSGVAHRAGRGRPEVVASDAIERGRYGTQLRRALELFPREQLLVLQYERCLADPAGQYARTLRHLGVEADHRPDDFLSVRGQAASAAKPQLWPELVEALHLVLDPEVTALKALVGDDIDLSLWSSFAHLG